MEYAVIIILLACFSIVVGISAFALGCAIFLKILDWAEGE
jgi:hypothetical protein